MAQRWAAVALLLVACAALAPACSAYADSEKIARLQALARRGGGLIELDDATFKELVVGSSRPYSVFLVADAKDLRRDPKLRLVPLVADLKLVAKTYAATHAGQPTAGAVFFARMEFSRSRNVFGRLGIKALPYVARIPPSLAVTEGGALALPSEELLSTASFPWSAELIGGWVAERSGLPVGEVVRAPLISARLMPLVSIAVLGCLAMVGYKLWYAPFMRHQALYALGALVVYWFSVSGGMFNIIRGVPMVGFDHRARKAMIFMQGQGQLGAEGFIMGSLYCSVGLSVAAFITLIPRVKDEKLQRVLAYVAIAAAFLAFRSVTASHQWKTGMSTHWYFP